MFLDLAFFSPNTMFVHSLISYSDYHNSLPISFLWSHLMFNFLFLLWIMLHTICFFLPFLTMSRLVFLNPFIHLLHIHLKCHLYITSFPSFSLTFISSAISSFPFSLFFLYVPPYWTKPLLYGSFLSYWLFRILFLLILLLRFLCIQIMSWDFSHFSGFHRLIFFLLNL